jgi:large subunit ribosomal protein L13
MKRQTHIIDVNGKRLGRIAGKIAVLLRGKNRPDFSYNEDKGDFVVIRHADKIELSGKKRESKFYWRHSGYLGHSKKIPFLKVFEKNPEKVLRKAVFGMLPKNKLRKLQIKRLKFK